MKFETVLGDDPRPDAFDHGETQAGQIEANAISDVIAERERQREEEGYPPDHDDHHTFGELARAAAVYAAGPGLFKIQLNVPLQVWPYQWDYKPKDRRRDLVRAAALIVAEIERLDRHAVNVGVGRT